MSANLTRFQFATSIGFTFAASSPRIEDSPKSWGTPTRLVLTYTAGITAPGGRSMMLPYYMGTGYIHVERVPARHNPLHTPDPDIEHALNTLRAKPYATLKDQALYRRTLQYVLDHYPQHVERPTFSDVLDCLTTDAEAIDCSFEQWASEFGYDSDSRAALAVYEQCAAAGREFRGLFTARQWADFTECTPEE